MTATTSTPDAFATAVPFLDLAPMHAPLRDALLDDLRDLIDRGAFTNGPEVGAFEAAFGAWCGTTHCVGLGTGLDALRLALLAAGLEPGDEVIVPASTFVATLEAVVQAGGVPVVVDIDPADYCMDVDAAAAAVTPRTRFLLPVHLYGQLADMRRLGGLAARCDLRILEDACQAHGATRDGIRAGRAGFAGAFSFYPGKNLGAFGDAGALVTDDAMLAANVRALREHGQHVKHHHELVGYTSRLDTLQAVVLLRKLQELDRWTEERRSVAAFYDGALEGVGDLVLPPVPAGSQPVWHLYVVRTADPAALQRALEARGVRTGRHYPEPVHLSPAFAAAGHAPGSRPVAEGLAREALSLPLFPGMAEEQLDAVVEALKEAFRA